MHARLGFIVLGSLAAVATQAGCLRADSAEQEAVEASESQGVATLTAAWYDVGCDFCRPGQTNDPATNAAAVGAAKAGNAAIGSHFNIIRVNVHPGSTTTITRTFRLTSLPVTSVANFADEGFEADGEQRLPPKVGDPNTFIANLEGGFPSVVVEPIQTVP